MSDPKLTNAQRAMIRRRSREAAGLCIYCPQDEVQGASTTRRGKPAKGCRDCLDFIAAMRAARREVAK